MTEGNDSLVLRGTHCTVIRLHAMMDLFLLAASQVNPIVFGKVGHLDYRQRTFASQKVREPIFTITGVPNEFLQIPKQ